MSDEVGTNLVGAGQLVNAAPAFSAWPASRVFAARHRGAEGADARHVAVAPRLALLQEQAARLGGAIPVMTIGQTGDVIFQLAQSFGTDAPAVGKVKQAADKIWTLKIEKRAAVNPAAEVKTGPCAIVTASRGLGYSVSVTRGFGRRGLGKYRGGIPRERH